MTGLLFRSVIDGQQWHADGGWVLEVKWGPVSQRHYAHLTRDGADKRVRPVTDEAEALAWADELVRRLARGASGARTVAP